MLIQISAGQGPEECQIAVGKLFQSLKKEFSDIEIISDKKGRKKDYFHSIYLFYKVLFFGFVRVQSEKITKGKIGLLMFQSFLK